MSPRALPNATARKNAAAAATAPTAWSDALRRAHDAGRHGDVTRLQKSPGDDDGVVDDAPGAEDLRRRLDADHPKAEEPSNGNQTRPIYSGSPGERASSPAMWAHRPDTRGAARTRFRAVTPPAQTPARRRVERLLRAWQMNRGGGPGGLR